MDTFYEIGIIIWLCISIATLIGLARPSIFEKILKRFAKRRYIFPIGLLLFFIIPVALSPIEPASLKTSNSITQSPHNTSAQAVNKNSTPAPVQATAATVQTKQVSVQQAIPFSSQTQNDNSLPSGQTKITQQGVDGQEVIVYNVTLTNGNETSRAQQSTTVLSKPTPQITNVGTYIPPPASATPTQTTTSDTPSTNSNNSSPSNCTNGTYVNSSGNIVCSPETSSTKPSGATAQCNDGTYSFSQHHSGTCSHHGGVAIWY